MKVIGITETIKDLNKKTKLGEKQTKETVEALLEMIKENLIKGNNVFFKGYFTLKRAKKTPTGNKLCENHLREMEDLKRKNKGKLFFKSLAKSGLNIKIGKCNNCGKRKEEMNKKSVLLPRVTLKISNNFWKGFERKKR